jgi:Flp pilus assembly protein TadG
MRTRSGQALIEFSLMLPLLFLLIVNVINFGGMLYAWICVSNAARTGAQYFITGGATVGAPGIPTRAAVQTLVQNDLHPLPNSATGLQVCVSASNSATVSCDTGLAPAGTPPAVDTAEGSPAVTHPVGAVDVIYTYLPFIPRDFPALRIHATLPPTAIHRQGSHEDPAMTRKRPAARQYDHRICIRRVPSDDGDPGRIEFDRMVLVYTTPASSTRAGVRYAIVHGSDRTEQAIRQADRDLQPRWKPKSNSRE